MISKIDHQIIDKRAKMECAFRIDKMYALRRSIALFEIGFDRIAGGKKI